MDMAHGALWAAFGVAIAVMLALDLGVFHRKAHSISLREALAWSGVWIGLALAFNAVVYLWLGTQKGNEFLTAYLIEKSLSVDNIFVFVLVFSYFRTPAQHQHRVLYWGILGALVMRGVLIAAGATLLEHLHWVIYLFGAALLFTSVRLAREKETSVDPEKNLAVKLFRRFVPMHQGYEDSRFFVRRDGRTLVTLLLLVLVVVESTDLVFAVDSIPAVLAITTDMFIVYTSNIFAILGLRSLYFLLAGVTGRLRYLRAGLAAVLLFVGAKMVLSDVVEMPVELSLGVVGAILAVAVLASVARGKVGEWRQTHRERVEMLSEGRVRPE